ncbi:MAG: S-layer homology domain-containing protein, partial [Oscillospiraceae bacterium]|nr:S-layer homology domain-containing protein [Oscillospiraceae bacterium]
AAIANNNYTAVTWTALQAAIIDATAVRSTQYVTQTAVDGQITALQTAIGGLRKNSGGYNLPPPESTPAPESDTGKAPSAPPNPFDDIHTGDWFYDDVLYVYVNGSMSGTTSNKFSPQIPITRGMLVTVLYRIAGEPSVSGLDNPFDDVASGAWYANAVKWGASNGIIHGLGGGKYAPDAPITRQDLAAILYRYAQLRGALPSDAAAELKFSDSAAISRYARESVSALTAQGIVSGKAKNIFDPHGQATRAEVAAMLRRFLAAVA